MYTVQFIMWGRDAGASGGQRQNWLIMLSLQDRSSEPGISASLQGTMQYASMQQRSEPTLYPGLRGPLAASRLGGHPAPTRRDNPQAGTGLLDDSGRRTNT